MNLKDRKIVIVTDWIIGGGAEMITLELHKMFPDAPIYTSYCTPDWRIKLDNKVVTGYLQYWPFPSLRKFIPGMRGRWFERLNLEEFDLIISVTGAEAKGIIITRHLSPKRPIAQGAGENCKRDVHESTLSAGQSQEQSEIGLSEGSVSSSARKQDSAIRRQVHISYINAPTHYYWSRYDDYLAHPGFGFLDSFARIGLKSLIKRRRKWDYAAAQRPDYIIGNSTHIQSEIKKYYDRDSDVIFPPVDTTFFSNTKYAIRNTTRCGYIVVGRQTPYKRIDLAVQACTKLNLPLLVIGNGPDHQKLKDLAGPTIMFKTDANREDIARALASAKGFIFPGLDDFGIAPVEALAAGTPVLAYKAGGALDYVIPGKSGDFFDHQTVNSLAQSLEKFDKKQYSSKEIQSIAQRFSNQKFQESITEYLSIKIK